MNLQAGQTLFVMGQPEYASLMRTIAEAGWQAGAITSGGCTRCTRQMSSSTAPRLGWTTAGWANDVLRTPDVDVLWQELAAVARLDEADPLAAWRERLAALERAVPR